jgi:hypothetical protein
MKPKLYVSASVNGVTEVRLQNTHQRRSRGQKTDAESKRWRSLAEKQLRAYFVWRIDVILMRLRYRRAIAVYTAGLEADGEDSLRTGQNVPVGGAATRKAEGRPSRRQCAQ